MIKSKESKDLKLIREIWSKEKLDPKNVIEFYCSIENLEKFKGELRKKCTGKCFFFTKKNDDKIHVLALINITIENISNETVTKVIDNIKQKSFNQSSFNPISLKFNTELPLPSKKSPKT